MDVEGLFAVGAAVLTISALLAGVVARAPLSFPIIFLGLGLVLGEGTTGAVSVDLDSDLLQTVAFATLALVLFLDAMNLELAVMRRDWVVPALTLGPGALLVIVLTAVAAMVVTGLDPVIAFIVGAVLASTDPVVLRDILRDDRIPRSVRNALSIEGGTNDLIVLPPILILAAVATHEASGALSWLGFLGELLVIGPVAGAAVGLGGAWLMARSTLATRSGASGRRSTGSAWCWRRSPRASTWARTDSSPRSRQAPPCRCRARRCATASSSSARCSPSS